MRHVETTLVMGWGIKENGGGELNYDILKNICKCYNVPEVK
jgi:hypothetical protein